MHNFHTKGTTKISRYVLCIKLSKIEHTEKFYILLNTYTPKVSLERQFGLRHVVNVFLDLRDGQHGLLDPLEDRDGIGQVRNLKHGLQVVEHSGKNKIGPGQLEINKNMILVE